MINWNSPNPTANGAVMGVMWIMAAQKICFEAQVKKFFPLQYQAMQEMQKALAGG